MRVCGPGIVFRKPDLEGLNRAVEFVNSIKLLVDVFANNGIVPGEACCAHGVLGCLEIHVDSKKRELRGCYTLKVTFSNRLVTEALGAGYACHDNGNGAVHLDDLVRGGGFF